MSPLRGMWLAAMLLVLASEAHAEKCGLIDGEEVPCYEVRTWVTPEAPVAVGQRVDLNIEITTNQTLASGTRIGMFELPDLTVLRLSDFAVNSTRTRGGQSLNVQLWTLTLFPYTDGLFTIPEIPLSLRVRNDGGEIVDKLLTTEPVRFQSSIPEALRNIENWVAAETLTVTDNFDRPLEALKPGDAVTRTIRLQADSLPGMMLPRITLGAFKGMTAYPQLPKISDKTNRGQLRGERIEVIVYQIERNGEQVIPSQEFVWWNTETEKLQSVTLTEHSFYVGGGWFVGDLQNRILWFMAGMSVVILVSWAAWGGVKRYGTADVSRASTSPTAGQVRVAFRRSLRDGNVDEAVSLLYQWIDLCAPPPYRGSVRRYLRTNGSRELQGAFETMMRKRHEGRLQIEDVSECAKLVTAGIEKAKKTRLSPHQKQVIRLNEV